MKNWADLIWDQTESEFIPWYTDYWTQQWLLLKIAWYQLQEEDGADDAGERMKAYLLEQLHERAVQPVSEATGPAQIAVAAASVYLESLRVNTASIQKRNLIPVQAWRNRLEQITVIELETHPGVNASLYQLLQPGDPMKIAAYAALVEQAQSAEEVNSRHAGKELDRLVDRAVHTLEEEAALKGGAAVASAAAGGGIGLLLSAAVTAWEISEHNAIKPELESELRSSLKSVLVQITTRLVEDRRHGVLSLVEQMHAPLKEQLWSPPPPPVTIPLSPYPAENLPVFDALF